MENLEKLLKKYVSEKRLKHCQNVAKAAVELAKIHGADTKKAEIAGLLHDATKEFTLTEHLELMQKYNVPPEDVRVFDESVFHGFTGSIFAREIAGIKDRDILNAIKHHIVGRARMTLLEKIIFIADCISQERKYSGVNEMRKIAKKDLNKAIIKKLSQNITKFSFAKGKIINPNAFEAYNYIISEHFYFG